MASKVPFRLDRWVEIALAAAAATLVAAAVAPTPADAGVFGKKKPAADFSVARAPVTIPVAAPAPANGSIFQADGGYAALYEGWRAKKVGDPLTIVLVERTAASKSASSKLDSAGQFGITPPTTGPLALFGATDIRAGGNRGFNGQGGADQANSLSGEVSVTIAEVYSNGTALVRGQKRLTLNRGDEFVQIKGVIRLADVDLQNRVVSTRVADAQIAYTGKGDVARASRQGWLSRFFQAVSPF